jgi:hypothetical protein
LRPLCIKDLRGVCPVQVAAYSFFWFLLWCTGSMWAEEENTIEIKSFYSLS